MVYIVKNDDNEINDITMTTDKTEITIKGELYWKLREEAAKNQMDEGEYGKRLLQESLGLEINEEQGPVPDLFGDYVIQKLEVTGERRKKNVKRVAQLLYDAWEPSDSEILPWELWNQAIKDRAQEAAEERSNLDAEQYRSTVRGNIYDAGFDGEEQFREEFATLARDYSQRKTSD